MSRELVVRACVSCCFSWISSSVTSDVDPQPILLTSLSAELRLEWLLESGEGRVLEGKTLRREIGLGRFLSVFLKGDFEVWTFYRLVDSVGISDLECTDRFLC